MIDKEELKEYINQKYPKALIIKDISNIEIKKRKISTKLINSKTLEEIEKNGNYEEFGSGLGYKYGDDYIEFDVVIPTFDGWIINPFNGWDFVENRSNRNFNLNSYKNYMRNKKIELILV